MAKGYADIEGMCRRIIQDVRNGVFAPVYLLMGEEPYYPELICSEIMKNALTEEERDFNQSVYYGLDANAGDISSDARSYPMMAERRLIVIKEAQNMKTLENLSSYVAEPSPTTVLVVLLHGASVDKRKSFYKTASKNGVVFESEVLKDEAMSVWITSYFKSRGLSIEPEAANLFAESSGTDLGRIVVETEKLLKNLPENTVKVTVADIEKNVGISRQFSIFGLNKELSYKHVAQALKIAAYLSSGAKFSMPASVAALYSHFYKILKLGACTMPGSGVSPSERARYIGVNPYYMKEYETAARNYPVKKCMKILALLEEYDFKSKGGGGGEADPSELMMELVAKILN